MKIKGILTIKYFKTSRLNKLTFHLRDSWHLVRKSIGCQESLDTVINDLYYSCTIVTESLAKLDIAQTISEVDS